MASSQPASEPSNLGSTSAPPEGEAEWLSFLSGMAQQRQQQLQPLPSVGFGQQPLASSSSSAHSSRPSSVAVNGAAYPAAMPIGPEMFAFDAPPIGLSGVGHNPTPLLPHVGQSEQHEALSRFHSLFHPAGVGHQSSAHSSALHSPHLDAASAGSSRHPSPHPDVQPLSSHDDSSNHLSSFLSSFFPPPEPAHFTGPLSLPIHESSHPAANETIGRRPSSNFSFSPTAFANLHLPQLPGLGGPFNSGESIDHSCEVQLPHLQDPFAAAGADPLPVQCSTSSQPSSSFFPRNEQPAPPRQATVDSPLSPLLPLASSSAAPTPGPSSANSDSSLVSRSTSSRGRKRALPAARELERTSRRLSVAPASREDGTDAPPLVAPPVIVIGGEIDSPGEIANREAVEDDKRRRNTEASARFRAKKKHHTVNLQRTVSDLSSRVIELEVEASDLRQGVTFLRELVVERARGNVARASGGGSGLSKG